MRIDECAPKSGETMVSLDQAREIVKSRITPLQGFEQIVLKNCLGRILFEELVAPINIPQEARSSMDGFAFHSSNRTPGTVSRFKIAGTSWAGRPYTGSVENAECVRIFTGAAIPPDTDSVVIQENVTRSGHFIEIPADTFSKENIRTPGDEISSGQPVLERGKRLSPADMGILASLGINEIRVRRTPRVAFFSTGDELVGLDKPLAAGQNYDSNRYTLYGMLMTLGIEALDLGVIRDDRDAIVEALLEASAISDVLITSGGVSVGDADLVKKALQSVGRIEFWNIALKPGKPLAFGRIADAHFFGLPGNPVSVFVTFYQIVRPALLRLMGANPAQALRIQACCVSKINKVPGRRELQRGNLFIDEAGKALVAPAEKQQSHNLSAMARCNCFIDLPAECEGLEAGNPVDVELIESGFHFN